MAVKHQEKDEDFVPRPGLRQAKRRTMRAVEHTNEIAEILGEWAEEIEGTTPLKVTVDRAQFEGADLEEDSLDAALDLSGIRHPPTPKLSILAGEVVYNLRAALDYLVYQLAWLDSGAPVEQTQFPIETNKKLFWKRVRGYRLKGVSDEHAEMIAEYQPFAGCSWTSQLQSASNADKHRNLVSVTPEWSGEFRFDTDEAEPDPDDPTKLLIPVTSQVVRLIFHDGTRFPDSLKVMLKETAKILDRFQGDFGETDTLSISERRRRSSAEWVTWTTVTRPYA